MRQRSSTHRKACRVLGVEPSTPFESIARRYHVLVAEQRAAASGNDPTVAARIAALTRAWGRIKYEACKRRKRVARAESEHVAMPPDGERQPAIGSCAFDGCELRPTEQARCYRVIKNGVQLLTLHRHPDDARLLYARNERGQLVRVNDVAWWTDSDGQVRPVG